MDAIVFVKEHNVWAIVKGKEYPNGRFKYIYNGREAFADPYKSIPIPASASNRFSKDEVVRLNMNHLISARPKKRKAKVEWPVDDLVSLLMNEVIGERREPPIVELEEDRGE